MTSYTLSRITIQQELASWWAATSLKVYSGATVSRIIALTSGIWSWNNDKMGCVMRKRVFGHMRTVKALIWLRIRAYQGLHCPLPELLDTTEWTTGEQRPGWYFAHAQGDLNLRFCVCLIAHFAWRGFNTYYPIHVRFTYWFLQSWTSWTTTWENKYSDMYTQWRLKSSCATEQSDHFSLSI